MEKNRITYSLLVLLAIIVFTVGAKDATADYISGDIGFFGVVTPIDSSSTTTTDFSVGAGTTGIAFPMAQVTSATGDFVGFDESPKDATFYTFQFTPSIDPDPVDPLWETTKPVDITASFVMTSVTVAHQDAELLLLNGSGILKITDYDDTAGIWNFSSGLAIGGSNFFFSATSSTVVPEPSTMLLGIGLVGLIGASVRRRISKNTVVSGS